MEWIPGIEGTRRAALDKSAGQALVDELDDFDLRAAAGDGQPRDRGDDVEAPRAGGSGIDDEPAALAVDEGPVGVAVDDDVAPEGREERLRREAALLVAVDEVDGQPAGGNGLPRLQGQAGRIDVAVDRGDRSDRLQLVEHVAAADIAGMENQRHAAERVEHPRAHETVRIGDEPDYDDVVSLCDVHCHFFSSRFLELLSEGLHDLPAGGRSTAVSHRLGWTDPGTSEELADRWAAELDRCGVDRAALIASIPGDEASVALAVARHPTRFVGFFMFNPMQGDIRGRLARALGEQRFRGICLFPAMHGYRLDEERVREVFAAAAASGAVVFVHCGMLSVGVRKKLGLPSPFDLRAGDPLALAATASRFPSVPVIVPHFGAGLLRELLMAADQCANIHIDTSSSNGWLKYHPGLTLDAVFRQAKAVTGAGRLLFGTDSSFFPRGWQQPIHAAQQAAAGLAGFDDAERELLFGGNFQRLFKD